VKSDATCHRGSLLVAGTPLDGVEFRRFHSQADLRGTFTETFQENWGTRLQPVQWSVVESRANVLRGVHLHFRHTEYFSLLRGMATIGLRDARANSPSRNRWSLYQVSGEAMAGLIFPAGILHGWYFHEDSVHLQAVSESHADYARDDNRGCHWSDPALEIPWPCTDPILSKRAAAFPRLRDVLSTCELREGPSLPG
jgi:dTDP-4-dehydrorhamnose 3,5-epimerase